jgi:hypothetical protein
MLQWGKDQPEDDEHYNGAKKRAYGIAILHQVETYHKGQNHKNGVDRNLKDLFKKSTFNAVTQWIYLRQVPPEGGHKVFVNEFFKSKQYTFQPVLKLYSNF